MKKIEIGQKVSLKCGKDYPALTGVIISLFEDTCGIPAAMVTWDDGETNKIHLTKIKGANAKYGLKLA